MTGPSLVKSEQCNFVVPSGLRWGETKGNVLNERRDPRKIRGCSLFNVDHFVHLDAYFKAWAINSKYNQDAMKRT